MANFRPIVINLLFIALFVVAIVTAGVMMAVQNNATQNIGNDSIYSDLASELNSKLQDGYTATSSAEQSFENSSVTLTSGIPFIDSIYGAWKVIKTTPMLVYNLITAVIFQKLLGDDASLIIISVISTILLITIIFAVVKLISSGDGG